jgi:polyhydroxyalkanoate synthesis regulator phasin
MNRIWANLSPLTELAVVLITLAGVGFHLRWSKRSTTLGPTLLTTLGIFFCFVGIAWGLLDFNTDDVRASVPHLLLGIRTSFWASVAGIGFALTIKARQVLFGDPRARGTTAQAGGATVDDLVVQLQLSRQELQLSRQDSNARLEALTASFDTYAKKVAESNSKALIQALQEVIRDFNAKINEQFGENFRHLNIAVGKLVEWQSGHASHLDALIEQETATARNMSEATLGYADLITKSDAFVTVAGSLGTLLTGLDTQRRQLESSLGGFASLVEKTAIGLPLIEQRIVAMTEQIESGVRANHDRLTAAFQTANASLNAHLRQATDDSKSHIAILDKALEEELRRAIESLGRQLTALSQKFVQDYTPLTAQLQRVLHSAQVS